MAAKKKTESEKRSYSLAKSEDGSIQITFNIIWATIDKELDKVAEELKDDVIVKGFRKGKAPVSKVRQSVDQSRLIEHALQHMLPELFASAVETEKLQPITYPKFELISTEEGKDWQVRAITAESPKFNLGDYKKVAQGALASKSIITPDKKESTPEEKEQAVLQALMESIKFDPPKVLVDDETNNRLGDLLNRIEKLGLNLDSYLASINKDANSLREEYKNQAEQTLKLEILLNAIAEEEKTQVSEAEIEEFANAAQGDPQLAQSLQNPTQKRIIASILRKRKVLNSLVSQ